MDEAGKMMENRKKKECTMLLHEIFGFWTKDKLQAEEIIEHLHLSKQSYVKIYSYVWATCMLRKTARSFLLLFVKPAEENPHVLHGHGLYGKMVLSLQRAFHAPQRWRPGGCAQSGVSSHSSPIQLLEVWFSWWSINLPSALIFKKQCL